MSIPSIIVGESNWAVKPGNLLGYANSQDRIVPREFAVTRALDTATRINSSGNIELVAANVPRIDFLGGQRSLLVEPSAKNFWLQSENLSSASWLKLAAGSGIATTVSASTESLFGLPTFEVTFTPNGTSSGDTSTIRQGFTPDATGNHTQSWYIRSTSGTQQLQAFFAGATVQLTITETPTRITATSNLTSIITWNSGLTQVGTHTRTNGKFLITAAQVEAGSVATSYIPTTAASVTRSADVVSLTNVAGLIGQTEGTIYAEVDLSRITTNAILSLNDGTGTNRFIIQFFSSTVLLADIRVAGVNANYSVTIPAIPANGGIYKVALGYKANDYCFALNGTTYASTASRGVPATTQINLGNYLSSNQFNDRIRAAEVYTTRLTNAQLATLTAL